MTNSLLNKSTRQMLTKIVVVMCLGTLINVSIHWLVGFLFMMVSILGVILFYENKRRKELVSLTMYLKRLNHNDYDYEIVHFDEGDLSLLKSEVHKTMYLLKANNQEKERQKHFIYKSLSDISHQLKTPITGLQLMLDLMDEESDYLGHMGVQVDRLQTLVEGLLTHIQLEADSIKMQSSTITSHDLINKLIDMVHTDVPIQLEIESFNFVVDLKWTLEALFNVLNNKLRYAHNVIHIKVYRNKLYQIIEISDDGDVIQQFERERLFERFYKGEQGSSDSVGIGLAITKEIMELQKGKVLIVGDNTFKFLFDDNIVTSF